MITNWQRTVINRLDNRRRPSINWIQTFNCVANFILAKFKDQIQANSCYSFLEEKGILVRKIGEYGLPEYLRITVGLEDENKILCDEINNFLKLNGK